ncbi:MAG: hypothetical protein HYY16_05770 [Planctomycetes bacterium]|nr:hypothetical protein [Planctomycetota bacterium]
MRYLVPLFCFLISQAAKAQDTVPPIGQVTINGGAAWETCSTTKVWTLNAGDGPKAVYAQFRDSAGNVSAVASDGIGLDTTPPAASLQINGGAAWTNTSTVTLQVQSSDSSSGVASRRFSNDGISWTAWEALSSSRTWTLPAGNVVQQGTRIVYVQVCDLAGNVSSTASDSIGLDTIAPAGTVLINGGGAWTPTSAVTLTLTGTDDLSGIAEMRFCNDASWSSWRPFTASSSWTLAQGEGQRTVQAQFRDAAGNVSTAAIDTIGLDELAPTGSISISAGAAWTNGVGATLTLSAVDGGSGVAQARFSGDGASWSEWEAYGASRSWVLPGGDGTKSVHVQFRDALGNVSAGVSDDIGLDTVVPGGTILIQNGAAWATGTWVRVYNVTIDPSPSSGVTAVRYSNDGATWGAWATMAPSVWWAMSTGDGTKQVYAQFRDGAGNVSVSLSDTIKLDTTMPSGTVVINAGVAWTAVASVTLNLAAADTGSGVAKTRLSNDGTSWSAWEPFAGARTWLLGAGDGTKQVYAQFQDAAGNTSASVADSISLDTTAPAGSIAINGGAAWTNVRIVTLTLSMMDAHSGVSLMRFSNDDASWTAWETYAVSKTWMIPSGDGPKTVYVQVSDALGNTSASLQDSIGLDTVRPQMVFMDINNEKPQTVSVEVTLTILGSDDASGLAQMRITNEDFVWSPWEPYSTSKAWALRSEDGEHGVYVQVRDAAGNTSALYRDLIWLYRLQHGSFASPAVERLWPSVEYTPFPIAMDIAIVGDGFRTASEMLLFKQFAEDIARAIANTEPFKVNLATINIWRVNVVSDVSWIDEFAGSGPCPNLNSRNSSATPFELAAAVDGNCRHLRFTTFTPDASLQAALGHPSLPDCDAAIFVGNTGAWVGTGYFKNQQVVSRSKRVSTVNTTRISTAIAVHELGHGLGLGDEYYYGGSVPDPQWYPNLSGYVRGSGASIKWWSFTHTSEVPTERYFTGIGTFDLAYGETTYLHPSTGVARSQMRCLMRNMNGPYCTICQRGIVAEMRLQGNDAAYPAEPPRP